MVFSFTPLHLGYQYMKCASKCYMEFQMCRRSKYTSSHDLGGFANFYSVFGPGWVLKITKYMP
jgi:hypothetical protein